MTNANYADSFYVSADILDFDDTVRQVFGIAARISTPGLGSTDGYLFSWEPGGGTLPGTSNGDLDITILDAEAPIDQVETAPSGLHLEKGKSYRFVFMGRGPYMEGQVFELPDTTNALIRLPAYDETYTSGVVGLIVASQGSMTVAGDATFDNFYASDHDPRGHCDGFRDGNDTAPPPPWIHYDPIGGLGGPAATFTFPSGGYRIFAPASPDPINAGPARAGSFVTNTLNTDTFYLSADVIDFDDTVRQAFGIAARITEPGPGTTGGYLFSWEPGSGPLPGTANGDLDISVLVGENPAGQIETAPSGLHLTRGQSYRFVFMGRGSNFVGQVYQLPDTEHPLITLPANDPNNTYTNGTAGLIVACNNSPNYDTPADATFDNFVALSVEPKLAVGLSGGNVTVSWPALTSYILQSTPSLSSPVWTDITSGIQHTGPLNVYTVSGATGTMFYRLRCDCD